MRDAIRILTVVMCISLLNACSGSDESSDASSNVIPAGVNLSGPVNNHGTSSVKRFSFDVEMYDDYFQPTFFEVQDHTQYTVTVRNKGSVAHTFAIASLNLNASVQPGDRWQQWITFSDAGSYEFVCPDHSAIGMRGAVLASASS